MVKMLNSLLPVFYYNKIIVTKLNCTLNAKYSLVQNVPGTFRTTTKECKINNFYIDFILK